MVFRIFIENRIYGPADPFMQFNNRDEVENFAREEFASDLEAGSNIIIEEWRVSDFPDPESVRPGQLNLALQASANFDGDKNQFHWDS